MVVCLLAFLGLTGRVQAQERFVIVPEPVPLNLYDMTIAFRLDHQDFLFERQIMIHKFPSEMYGEFDLRVGLIPDNQTPWISGLEFDIGTFMGGPRFPNTPVTRFGLVAGFLPLGRGEPVLGVGLHATPAAMDHNATFSTVTLGHRLDSWNLDWIVGAALGYQEAGGSPTFIGSFVAGVSWEVFAGLRINLEYEGRFTEGAFNLAIGYTIGQRVQLYLTAPANYRLIQPKELHSPAFGGGVVVML